MNEHKVRVYNTAGTLQSEMTDFISLSVTKKVNAPGVMTIDLSGYHNLLSLLEDKWRFEYWRKPEGSTWAKEFTGL